MLESQNSLDFSDEFRYSWYLKVCWHIKKVMLYEDSFQRVWRLFFIMHLKLLTMTRSRANLACGNGNVLATVGIEMSTEILLKEVLLSFVPCFKAPNFVFREQQITQHVVPYLWYPALWDAFWRVSSTVIGESQIYCSWLICLIY